MPRAATRRRSRRDEDEYDEPTAEEETPRRGRSRTRDEDDDARPARARRSRSHDEDEERPARRRSRDEHESDPDDDERKERFKKSVGSGWSGLDDRKVSGDFPDNFKPSEDAVLIKFLDDEPVVAWREYWLAGKSGKKSYVQLADDDPLAQQGNKATAKAAFNIVSFAHDEPVLKVWTVGQKVGEIIQGYAQESRTKPINREDLYFSVRRTGSQKKGWNTTVNPVKERDLDEDWGIEPLSDDELADFEELAWDAEKVVHVNTWSELQTIADELDD